MVADLVVKGGKLVTPEGIIEAGIAIKEGKIVKIAKEPGLPEAERVIKADGKLIMPGVIDAHAHIHDPDYTYREDFESGSKAAAAGGVTLLIDMPLVLTVLSDMIERKKKEGERLSVVDFSFHAGMMMPEYVEEIPKVVSLGVKSFKLFTTQPFKVDWQGVRCIVEAVSRVEGVTVVHAEDDAIISEWVAKVRDEEGRKDVLAHFDSRPSEAEGEAIRRLIHISEETCGHIHIAHMTTTVGTVLVRDAKERGISITAETCPQYLVFTRRDAEKQGPYLKMTPPLRTRDDVISLWKGLADGTIDMVVTDHAPGTKEEKEVGWEDIWKAWGGIPGVETLLPIMLSEGVNKGRITPMKLVEVMCQRPSEVFGLYPRKGALREGSDGDLVILDMKKEVTIRAENLHYKVGWTPYEGMKVVGYPEVTVLRGEVVAEDGRLLGRPGYGKFVPMR